MDTKKNCLPLGARAIVLMFTLFTLEQMFGLSVIFLFNTPAEGNAGGVIDSFFKCLRSHLINFWGGK